VKPEPIEIALRAYVPPKKLKKQSYDAAREERPVLVIDTETTEDEYQNLIFGSCGIWVSGYPHKFILFYAPDLSEKGIDTLRRYAQTHEAENTAIEVISAEEFAETIFFPWLIESQAVCVGFNLSFDLSRLAIRYGYGQGKWKNGFTFWLTEDTKHPGIHMRSLDSVRSFFRTSANQVLRQSERQISGPTRFRFRPNEREAQPEASMRGIQHYA
jgi:hypothetical protein